MPRKMNDNNYTAMVDRGIVCCSSCCQTTLKMNLNVNTFKKGSVKWSVLGETAYVVPG